MRSNAVVAKLPAEARARLCDYYALCKPRVVMLLSLIHI